MKKRFNITGLCFPDEHYMADVSKKLDQTFEMVEYGDYFVINRPRQYGKTTTLYTLADMLTQTGEYIVFNMSFEGTSDSNFENDAHFAPAFVKLLAKSIRNLDAQMSASLLASSQKVTKLDDLSDFITDIAMKTDKKLVLLIDEVDKSSNNQLFVSFLAMLRNKYLERNRFKTFHSVVLAGVHDVKTLKLKLRPDEEQKLNSPWNIATRFKVDMSLQPFEIVPMLEDYCKERGVEMDTQVLADRLFYHTSGYPFLVSHLCKTIAEDILPAKTEKTWTLDDVEESVRLLLKENNTNFDSLIKNLENNQTLYDFVYRIIMDGDIVPLNINEPLIALGLIHGIFKTNGHIKIHNRIYEQLLYDYMTVKTEVSMKSRYNYGGHFVLENSRLDVPAMLLKFQQFMKEEFSERDKSFLEKHGRLVFLSFLSPILNGKGHSFKEVQTSEEKRLDIVVTFNEHKYIIELKRWYGETYHQKGINQLSNYLDIHAVHEGFLVIFEYNKVKSWRNEWIEHKGKRIFAVWI